jgi:hypothetical protein
LVICLCELYFQLFMPILDKLNTFILKERSRFENKDDNIFAMTFCQIIRYRQFLEIIHSRYQKLSKDFIENCKKNIEVSKRQGNGPISTEMMALIMESGKIGNELQLEIESFYQFAKILLDRIANTMRIYFGNIQGVSYESHNKFYKTIKTFISDLKLEKIGSLVDRGNALTQGIIDFRDDHIVHKSCARDTYGISWDGGGKTQISKTRIYAKETDTHVTSDNLDELLGQIDLYMESIISLISHNQDKTVLNLKI